MTALHHLTLTEVAERIATGSLTAVALCDHTLTRIESLDGRLGSFVTVTAALAREQAEQADARQARGEPLGALHGVPIAVKDLCDTTGVRTSAGMALFADRVPTRNATLVQRLLDAGAVLVGKVKTTEGACTVHHPSVAAPLNPWNADYWSGASSSGSGVSVAAGLCYGAIGTDTAGSIRFPSAANGIVGLKPTFGRVPKDGVFPLGASLDHPGPMTRSVADAARMLSVLAGVSPNDRMTVDVPVDDYAAELAAGVAGLRIAWDERYATENVGPDLAAGVVAAARELERLGATLVPVEVPSMQAAVDAFVPIFHAEMAAAHHEWFAGNEERYGPHLRAGIEVGLRVTGVEYARAHEQRLEFRGRLNALLSGVDALLCPPCMTSPPPVTAMQMSPPDFGAMKIALPFTTPYDLAGVPTLTLPCGFNEFGLPLALQLIGGPFREARLLRIGAAFERATEWHERHPIE